MVTSYIKKLMIFSQIHDRLKIISCQEGMRKKEGVLFHAGLGVQRQLGAGRAAGLGSGAGFPAHKEGFQQHLQLRVNAGAFRTGGANQAHTGLDQQVAAPALGTGAGVAQTGIHVNPGAAAQLAATAVLQLAQEGNAHPQPQLPRLLPGLGHPCGLAAGAHVLQREGPGGAGGQPLKLQAEALPAEPFPSAGHHTGQEQPLCTGAGLGPRTFAAGAGPLGQGMAAAGAAGMLLALGAAGAVRWFHHIGQSLPAPFRTPSSGFQ